MNTLLISTEIFGSLVLLAAFAMGILFRRYEVSLAVAMLFGATLWHAQIAGRWEESNITAEEFAKRFQYVPLHFGDWEGQDLEVSSEVQKGSGAVGYVSRIYTKKETNEQVQLWLIVGHARDICQHQPTACYPAHGSKQRYEPTNQKIPYRGSEPAEFWMTEFDLGGSSQVKARDLVLWAWAKPNQPGDPPPNWVAPKVPRMMFRNTKALYKMYFTSHILVSKNVNQREVSPAIDFASLFLPEVNKALFSEISALENQSIETTSANQSKKSAAQKDEKQASTSEKPAI